MSISPSKCKHNCKDKTRCKHKCCKPGPAQEPPEPEPEPVPEGILGPDFFTPTKKLTPKAKEGMKKLTKNQRKALIHELRIDGDDDSGSDGNGDETPPVKPHKKPKRPRETSDDSDEEGNEPKGKNFVQSLNAGKMRRDAARSIALLEDPLPLGPVMAFFQSCGAQRAGKDYSPAVSAAVSRTTCACIRSACLPAVDAGKVRLTEWKSLVGTYFNEACGSRFLSQARNEWELMMQREGETPDSYANRNYRMYQGYDYVAQLLGRDTEDDHFSFVIKWIKGLNADIRPGVSVACGEDPTMHGARLAARRLQAAVARGDGGDSATLKRKIADLEAQVNKNKHARSAKPNEQDLIAMVGPMVNERMRSMSGAFSQAAANFRPPPPAMPHPHVMPPPPSMLPPPGMPPPPPGSMGPPPPQSNQGVPTVLQACAMHYSGKLGCTKSPCTRSHNVPSAELPPAGACYTYFYGPCRRGKACRFTHIARHPNAKN